jgi:3-oxoacyl-[acyl-carrier-protein] synthase-3
MKIEKISTYLPENILTTQMLSEEFSDWPIERILKFTGVKQRHISHSNEYVSDMAVAASEKLFCSGVDKNEIDYIILCTQTPDYMGPTIACLVQSRLKLNSNIGAIDVNLGCSGYIYALSLAYGLIKSKQVKAILMITSDVYSKILYKEDKATRALFGDAATATLIRDTDGKNGRAQFLFGTDGSGAENLIIKNSGTKAINSSAYNTPHLHMNGPEIMNFALKVIPEVYMRLINESNVANERIKYFIFHQASKKILTTLKDKLLIDDEKFIIDMAETGNTISSTIPIVMSNLYNTRRLSGEDTILLLGFGIGYSWAGCILNID